MVKPLSTFMSILLICFVLVVVLPQVFRLNVVKAEILPVSVTSLGTGVEATHSSVPAPLIKLPEKTNSAHGTISGYPGLTDFAASLIDGNADEIVGVYASSLFALPVRQQPSGQPDYVARDHNVITQFGLPKKYGSVGLLAHNYLSGSRFFQLQSGQDIVLVYGDGRLEHYRVSVVESFRALKPNSPFSDFVDLADPMHSILSSADLFNRVYTTRHQVVFQTCIESGGEPSWGRMFIVASLAEPLQLLPPHSAPITSLN